MCFKAPHSNDCCINGQERTVYLEVLRCAASPWVWCPHCPLQADQTRNTWCRTLLSELPRRGDSVPMGFRWSEGFAAYLLADTKEELLIEPTTKTVEFCLWVPPTTPSTSFLQTKGELSLSSPSMHRDALGTSRVNTASNLLHSRRDPVKNKLHILSLLYLRGLTRPQLTRDLFVLKIYLFRSSLCRMTSRSLASLSSGLTL